MSHVDATRDHWHSGRSSCPIAGVDTGDDRASGVCNDRGADSMNSKFPIDVEPPPIKTIATSLWSCVKYGVFVFVVVWAVMRLFGM
jgi:hypothetical protein